MNDLRPLMIQLWQSACMDQPMRPSCTVVDGHFRMTINGNRDQWIAMMKAAGVPSHAEQRIEGSALAPTLVATWPSHADELFGADGPIARQIGPGYEVRHQQIQMGRLVQRSIEMGEPAVVEAGTGTGKSFAYAAVAMAMEKRIIISTSNKALQMQLYKKDIPFLQRIFPSRAVALAVGKSNYACRHKAEGALGVVTIDDPKLSDWYLTTQSGNLEEIPFAADWKALDALRVDEDCTGKACPFYAECFYYLAKERRNLADIIITNHALLCLDQMYPGAGILPKADVIVVDEAHKLADYARNALGVELTVRNLEKAIKKAERFDADTGEAWRTLYDLQADLNVRQYTSDKKEIPLERDETLPRGLALADALNDLAEEIWNDEDMPDGKDEIAMSKAADYISNRANWLRVISSTTEDLHVRYIDQSDKERIKLVNVPFDVSGFLGKLAGFDRQQSTAADHTQCARCNRRLSAAVVNVLDGRPYGPECIKYIDPFGDAEKISLDEWLSADRAEQATERDVDATPVIFTSATLAAPDMAHFMREAGIERALQMQVESPFDYKRQALFYVPNGSTPDPRHTEEYQAYLVEDLRRLVTVSRGGAFLLFTSYANMRHAADVLRYAFEREGWTVFVQGELPKLEIAKRFAEDGNAVLFATKSFFEGVSIDGAALRLVVIDKMPFEAPSPLNTAQEAALKDHALAQGMPPKQAEWYPFDALRVPKMVIELKQGVGRLIRTATDWGVFAILDPRLRTAPYARRAVLPALPRAPMVASIEHVRSFYDARHNERVTQARSTATEERKAKAGALFAETVVIRDADDLLLWG